MAGAPEGKCEIRNYVVCGEIEYKDSNMTDPIDKIIQEPDPTAPETKGMKPKISAHRIIQEVADHTGLSYHQAADAVYAFLHYVKYTAFLTDRKMMLQHFGHLEHRKFTGRVYSVNTGQGFYKPDTMRLYLKTNSIEVPQWKNTESIHRTVVNALDAALPPGSMDLSVCVRIADLTLSNKPIASLRQQERVEFIRKWILATGASPLLPSARYHGELNDRPFASMKFRLRGKTRVAVVFDFQPDPMAVSLSVSSRHDIVFLPDTWVSAVHYHPRPSGMIPSHQYGESIEDNCASLYRAYKAVKYGEEKTKAQGSGTQDPQVDEAQE